MTPTENLPIASRLHILLLVVAGLFVFAGMAAISLTRPSGSVVWTAYRRMDRLRARPAPRC